MKKNRLVTQEEFNIRFKKRALILLALFTVWVFIAATTLLYFSLINRNKYIIEGYKLAMRRGYYSAGRGRIMDSKHVPLAWSERFFDLLLLKPPELPRFKLLMEQKLHRILPKFKGIKFPGACQVIYYNIPPNKIAGLERLIHQFPDLKIVPRTERVVVDIPHLKEQIGKVAMRDGMLHGVSGFELQYDQVLSGELGVYTIMLDRHKNFISGTWHLIKAAKPGEDVVLPFSCAELKKRYRKNSHE